MHSDYSTPVRFICKAVLKDLKILSVDTDLVLQYKPKEHKLKEIQMAFNGFTPKALEFFDELAENNNKTWFEGHRSNYDLFVLEPARELVIALGERLRELASEVVVDPRVNKTIFRIYRDTRFSADKTPYKTNLALWFPVREGAAKFDHPGYYFSLDAKNLMIGAGIHTFSKPLLNAYREAVLNPDLGESLVKSISDVVDQGYGVGEKTYKRVPRGFDPDHKFAEFLCFSGLTVGINLGIPKEFYHPDLVNHCFEHFQNMAPIVNWLEEVVNRA